MKMSALLSRNASSRPGVTGVARVDRDIDRLLRRVGPGDIAIIDALDLDRITADALVEAGVSAVVNASPSISGRYPNLRPEVLVANGSNRIQFRMRLQLKKANFKPEDYNSLREFFGFIVKNRL